MKRILFLILSIATLCAAQPPASLSGRDVGHDASTVTTDSLASAQAAISPPQENGRIPLTKHNYEYKSQMILGVGMMAFIALIMGTAQAWNPR